MKICCFNISFLIFVYNFNYSLFDSNIYISYRWLREQSERPASSPYKYKVQVRDFEDCVSPHQMLQFQRKKNVSPSNFVNVWFLNIFGFSFKNEKIVQFKIASFDPCQLLQMPQKGHFRGKFWFLRQTRVSVKYTKCVESVECR